MIIRLMKEHWQLWLITVIVFLLWNHPVSTPVKIFVVFLHELSHALATWLTGGKVLELSVSAQQGGSVLSQGGNGFIIASAGYLGSLLLGALLFILALKAKIDRFVIALLGVTMIALTVFFIRTPFAVAFCLGVGLLFLAASKFLPREFNDLCLRVIGLSSLIYVPFDIFSDTLQRSYMRSDARILAEMYGGPTMFWGSLWLLISLIVIYAVLRFSLKTPSNIQRDDTVDVARPNLRQ